MKKEKNIEILNDAFLSFREASSKLEAQYAVLEKRIEELNAELAEKNRAMERHRRLAAMGEMAAKIAHEIRNPLGSISIFASLLEREFVEEEAGKKRLAGHITKGVKALDNILSNMLLFTNSPPARLKPVNIAEVIEDALLLTRGREKGDVRIDMDCEALAFVEGDGGLLRQLFLNLFLNALDAMEDGGTLGIKGRMTQGGASGFEAEVSDTGCGIAPEHLDRIFDPFFSGKERGTGLGLPIVASVVSAHGGTIDVRSKAGEGTVFTVTLPAHHEEGSLSKESAAMRIAQAGCAV